MFYCGFDAFIHIGSLPRSQYARARSSKGASLRIGIVRHPPSINIFVFRPQLTLARSIGGFYAFILGRAKNVELSVVARSNYDVVKAEVGAENERNKHHIPVLTIALHRRV